MYKFALNIFAMQNQSIKNVGKIVGVLFFVVMLLWYLGYATIGAVIDAPDYLKSIYPNKIKVMTGVLFELLEAAAVMGITFLLFPILKRRSDTLAISYMGFRVFETMMLLLALLCVLMLITLSRQYIESGMTDSVYFETTGILLKETRLNWSLYILGLFHPLAALPLYYFLYQSKLIPRFISIWGFLAALWILIDEVILETFGLSMGRIGGNPIAGIAMGLNEIILGIWLIIKGFDEDAFVTMNNNNNKV